MNASEKKSTRRTMSLSKKLTILVASAVVGVIAITGSLLYAERGAMVKDRKDALRQIVETAHGVIAHYGELDAKGLLPREEAQRRAKEGVKALRYNQNDYFWINTDEARPHIVMNPTRPEATGKDASDIQDPTGKHTYLEFVKVVKQDGHGFVPYKHIKPGSKDHVDKMAYVKGYAPWGWIVGSGIYMDVVDKAFMANIIKSSIQAAILAIILFGVGVIIARSIIKQIGGEPEYAVGITRQIAGGDLTTNIELRENDSTSLLSALREMRNDLARAVGQVRSGSEAITSASEQIAAGNMDLSSRTEEQASSLEQTASSMEELTSTVRQNAENAQHANQLAITASDVAVRGGAVVSNVVETMSAINESSRKMADIINVIDGIAFQTNILALNAAVEAARAGEQGRGFAVVASEVRNLAQRSATAAREIKELIDNSVSKVEAGSTLVETAGTTMQEIVASIKRVNDIMSEITAASREQSDGIEQVNQAIAQMDQVTQQNAALVEEAAAAAEAMQDQSRKLLEVVSVFRLDASQAAPSSTEKPKQATPAKQQVSNTLPQKLTSNRPSNTPSKPARIAKSSKSNDAPRLASANEADWEEF